MKKSKRKYEYNYKLNGEDYTYRFRKNPRSIYADYVKKYKTKRNYLADNFSAEMNVPMLNYKQWKETYIAKHNDQVKEVKAGIRKNVGAINQELVSEQIYEYSLKQAKRLQEVIDKNENKKLSITAIRLGNVDWEGYKQKYWELRAGPNGLTGKEAKDYMSWYFFGSE